MKWDLFQGYKGDSIVANPWTRSFLLLTWYIFKIILIDAEKASDKVQCPYMIKALNKEGLEGTQLNRVKAIYKKPITNIILSGGKPRTFPLNQEQDKDVHSHHFYSAIRKEKEISKLVKKK